MPWRVDNNLFDGLERIEALQRRRFLRCNAIVCCPELERAA